MEKTCPIMTIGSIAAEYKGPASCVEDECGLWCDICERCGLLCNTHRYESSDDE